MKTKTNINPIILLLPVFIMLVSCEQQKAEWKGIIEEVDGVTIVKNPEIPFHGELILDLEEDISIGNEKDENYLFYRVRGIALDSEENIYVADSGNYRIQKFDRDGKYLQTIGRKGEGPGEFRRPLGICFNAENNLYVLESRKMQIFNKLGEFKKSFHFDVYLDDFCRMYSDADCRDMMSITPIYMSL